VAHEDRGRAMAASLVRTARSAGVDADGLSLLASAHALAMEPRVARLEDDHHPHYLHPGRTALILLRDAEITDATLLAAGTLVESEVVDLRAESDVIRKRIGSALADTVGGVPLPKACAAGASGEERGLVEVLVTAERGVLLVALAERLDQYRHAHLWATESRAKELLVEGAEVYGPVCERSHPRLAARMRHWERTFRRRLERGWVNSAVSDVS